MDIIKRIKETPPGNATLSNYKQLKINNMTKHLRLSCYMGYNEHPQQTMKRLGITYQHATPQSMGDQWWFWNCENVPDPLPEHFSILVCKDPFELVGYGLSKEDAKKIRDYVGTGF